MTPSAQARRLNGREIKLLRFLAMHALRSHGISGVTLKPSDRAVIIPLWRRGLVNTWFRQVPNCSPSPQGPYFTLSHAGLRLAESFMRPGPKGDSHE